MMHKESFFVQTRDPHGNWRWVCMHGTKIVASSSIGYADYEECTNSIRMMKDSAKYPIFTQSH